MERFYKITDSIPILEELEKEFYGISNEINLSKYLFNPVNLTEEKKKFFEKYDNNTKYSPKYEYPQVPQTTLNAINELNKLIPEFIRRTKTLPKNILTKSFVEILIDENKTLTLLGSDRGEIFRRKLTDLYGLPSTQTVQQANEILNGTLCNQVVDNKTISTYKLVKSLSSKLKNLNIPWNAVEEENLGARFSVNSGNRQIKIRANHTFNELDLKRLLIHEIGTHVLRSENGKNQPLQIFLHGFKDYLATEEGLATILEERHQILSSSMLTTYAGRALATNIVMKPFEKIFQELIQYFDKETSFEITHRIKRGLKDTKQAGGFTKDFIYLLGRQQISEYLKNGNPIESLYIGKIRKDQAPEMNTLVEKGILVKPKYLPSWISSNLL